MILEVSEKLRGLTVAQADLVLREVSKLIACSTVFDTSSPAFHAEVRAYNQQFGEHHPLKTQQ